MFHGFFNSIVPLTSPKETNKIGRTRVIELTKLRKMIKLPQSSSQKLVNKKKHLLLKMAELSDFNNLTGLSYYVERNLSFI